MDRRLPIPLVTLLLIASCLLIFTAIASDPAGSEGLLAGLGVYFLPFMVWDGAYSSLLGVALVHYDALLLLLNVILIWVLGRRVEEAFGSQATFGLVFFAAILGSGVQLACGEWPAIGASGLVCALFGAMMGARRAVPSFEACLRPEFILLLLGWFLLCVPLSLAHLIVVSNGANAAGFAMGWAASELFVRRRHRAAAGAAIAALSVAWMPWNGDWQVWRYIRDHYGPATALAGARVFTTGLNDAIEINTTAWTLAASPRAEERNAARAIDLARQACALTMWREPAFIDTLAAAYAEAGRWKEAQVTQEVAVMLADELPEAAETGKGGDPGLRDEIAGLKTDLHAHLEAIRAGEKIRDQTLEKARNQASGFSSQLSPRR